MMRFHDFERDSEFMALLRDASILTPEIIEKIDAALGRPETGTLTDFLLAGADLVPEQPWLTWLIRRHGCHRVGPVALYAETVTAVARREDLGDNLPYRLTADSSLLIAVLRPDRWTIDTAKLAPRTCIRIAATLTEVRALRTAWRHSSF